MIRYRDGWGAGRGRRGLAMLAILIVVVIIMGLMAWGYFGQNGLPGGSSPQQVSQGIQAIDRSQDVACMSNRNAIRTDLMQMQIANGGQMPPIDQVREKLSRYKCPDGGAIVIGPDGTVYCTKHAPPPLNQLKQMTTLFEEKVATPVPPPPVATPMQ